MTPDSAGVRVVCVNNAKVAGRHAPPLVFGKIYVTDTGSSYISVNLVGIFSLRDPNDRVHFGFMPDRFEVVPP